MKKHILGLVTCVGVSMLCTGPLVAQRRQPGQAPAKQGITTSLKVGGQTIESSQPGKCTHAPVASIYQVMAELYSIEQSAGERSVTLTHWIPKDKSGEMFSLGVSGGNASHRVTTVRGGTPSGSGTVKFEKSGNGGVFTIDAKTKDGATITGTIKCDAFGPHIAEGGN